MARVLVKKITDNKNYIINSDFSIWQRNLGISGPFTEDTTLGYKSADRWRHRFDDLVVSSTVRQWARVFDAPVNNSSGYPSAFRSIFRRGNTGIYNCWLQQRIESMYSRELLNENPSGKMSVGCWVKSDTVTQVRITILVPTALDNHTSQTQIYQNTFTITANSTWQQVKYENLSVPSGANLGMAVSFELLTPAAVGADVADKEARFTMAQVCKGEIVPSFERAAKTQSQELALCQRYYEKSYNTETNPGTITANNNIETTGGAVGTGISCTAVYKVSKRAVPTLTIYNPVTGNSGSINSSAGAISPTINSNGTESNSVSSGGSSPRSIQYHYTADSEL